MASTFNYLTRAAKDRTLFQTAEGGANANIIGGVLNVTATAPYFPFRGYCGARMIIYMVQVTDSTFELKFQNAFGQKYEGVDPNQNNFDLSLLDGIIVIINGAFRPDVPILSVDQDFAVYVDPQTLTGLFVKFLTLTVPTAPQENCKLQLVVAIDRDRRSN